MTSKLRDMILKAKPKNSIVESVPMDEENQYPWGLKVNLNGESLDKLDIKISKMTTDDWVEIKAIAYIENIRETKRRKGSDDRNLELQITKMAVKKTKNV